MRSPNNPYLSLIIYFALWKVFLISIACLSPGQGYDTSTSLLLRQSQSPASVIEFGNGTVWNWLGHRLISKLTRWDAIYFTRISARGYLFEQEWAFGWGFTRLVSWIVTGGGEMVMRRCRADCLFRYAVSGIRTLTYP